DLVNGIEAGGCWAADVKIAIVAESQMIGRDTRLQHSEDEDLPVTPNLEDGPAAVADVQASLAVKRDAGRNAHALGVGAHGSVLRHAVHRSIVTRGDIEVACAVESHAGRVHHLVQEWLHVVVGVDAVDGDRDLLSAGAGEGNVNVALGVNRWIGNRMQVLCDGYCHAQLPCIALVAIGGNYDLTRGSAFGNARDDELLRADDDGAIHVAEAHPRAAQLMRTQTAAGNADLATGQSTGRIDGIDMWLAVHVLCARFSIHHANSPSIRSAALSAHNPEVQQHLQHNQRVHSRAKVIHYDTRSFGQPLEAAHRRRFYDVEPTEKYKARKQSLPHDGTRDERHQLSGDFINHDVRRVFLAASPLFQRRRRNSNRDHDDDQQHEHRNSRAGRKM